MSFRRTSAVTPKLERPSNQAEAFENPEAKAHLHSVYCCRSGWDPRNRIANKFYVMLTLLMEDPLWDPWLGVCAPEKDCLAFQVTWSLGRLFNLCTASISLLSYGNNRKTPWAGVKACWVSFTFKHSSKEIEATSWHLVVTLIQGHSCSMQYPSLLVF